MVLKHTIPLLLRFGMVALAIVLVVGAWSNREFITALPFLIQTVVDITFALALCYGAYVFTRRTLYTRRVTVLATAYVCATQIVSMWYYTYEVGTAYIAQSYGSYSQFLITQGLLDVGVPIVLLGLLVWGVYTQTK
jgi:hypothetical protein